ncbi:MAG: glycosyltransferase, partial [Longimicrobiales bacterium]|nr:glycosyltransferase [Longimicrobiales bacterium]
MPPVLIHRVIARLNVGGPAMHVVNLTRALDEGPWRTRLIAGSVPSTEGDMSYYAAERGVEVTLLREMSREISALDDVRALIALWRIFRRERPTVVHTHTAKAGTLGRVAAILAGVPVRVHTFHGHVLGGGYFAPWKTRLFLEIERQLARGTSRLVVLTRRQAREMSDVLRVAPPEKFAVVPLGLELDRFGAVDRSDAARAR